MTSLRPTRTPFIILPVWVLRHVEMTPTILVVYLALAERSLIDRKPPKGVGWVMAAAGLGRSAVYGALATLREMGAVVDGDADTVFLPTDDPSATVDYSSAHMDESSTHADRASTTEPREEPRSSPEGDTDEETFGFFWSEWPDRGGKKLGKVKALAIWKRLSLDDQRAAWRGAKNYAAASRAGTQGAMDAFRWLRDKAWDEWQTPATPGRPRGGTVDPVADLFAVEFDEAGRMVL